MHDQRLRSPTLYHPQKAQHLLIAEHDARSAVLLVQIGCAHGGEYSAVAAAPHFKINISRRTHKATIDAGALAYKYVSLAIHSCDPPGPICRLPG